MRASAYATYLQHLRRGELACQFSLDAARPVFPPREVSPYDIREQLEWRVCTGLGRVHSSTTVSDRKLGDYNVSLIDCDEGFRLMSRVEDLPPQEVRIGMRVRFRACVPADTEEDPYPVFVPLAEGQA